MRIAPARVKDVAGVVLLEREIVEAPHWAEAEYVAIVDAVEGSLRRCLLVAWQDEAMMGFAVGKVIGAEAELESVAVRSSARRGGVGLALCAAVVDWAWAQGAEGMDLEVRASSAGAIGLYRRLGFQDAGRRRGYYSDPQEDAVLMRLEQG
ncbi:ribosomal protein S18-alanine N-acetyltransferase [Granulicella arctica]|uniref:[Ribosomal protein bS18]-alanine N-acetyltransferase n=1 Tax=Granulicella arctica TaxID=940613 RepID=A0A7Y9TGS7_9BACT|nr:ribosomal protein S18-alanine N-acetyltransferase [Granulicella arctica]NYF79809.1 ribosomal-protein-alanine N-acetyltransferase [Granulicella arctica]